MTGTFWSLVPALVAIGLALITKEVYSSLFVGILIGAAFFTASLDGGFTFHAFLKHLFNDGLVKQLSDSYNVGILIFLVVLGIMVSLMNRAGGSRAFGNWAKKHIKTKFGAEVATVCLGILIFIDDYFNCLTVGSVMKPVTDKYRVSREKLAYLIDSTAAPICIIAPISSWAAAVSGFVTKGENGLALFCRAIPYNFYALLTIVMLFSLISFKTDFGPMGKYEKALDMMDEKNGESDSQISSRGQVIDLIFPIMVLIAFCTLGMIYSGGFFTKNGENHHDFINSFAGSDASVGLVIGSFGAMTVTFIFYEIRRVLTLRSLMECIPFGFKSMVPAILILTLAWTLKGMTDSLDAAPYVAHLIEGSASAFKGFLPAIIFIIACVLAFATGTSWGTFGILIPICIAAFPDATDPARIISISACMAGAVCGDHCSPISDTTIMASAGADCNHVNHVNTQLPYVMIVAAVSFACYVIAGFIHNPFVPFIIGAAGIIALNWLIGKRTKKTPQYKIR